VAARVVLQQLGLDALGRQLLVQSGCVEVLLLAVAQDFRDLELGLHQVGIAVLLGLQKFGISFVALSRLFVGPCLFQLLGLLNGRLASLQELASGCCNPDEFL
jgi:hypothetical protein